MKKISLSKIHKPIILCPLIPLSLYLNFRNPIKEHFRCLLQDIATDISGRGGGAALQPTFIMSLFIGNSVEAEGTILSFGIIEKDVFCTPV